MVLSSCEKVLFVILIVGNSAEYVRPSAEVKSNNGMLNESEDAGRLDWLRPIHSIRNEDSSRGSGRMIEPLEDDSFNMIVGSSALQGNDEARLTLPVYETNAIGDVEDDKGSSDWTFNRNPPPQGGDLSEAENGDAEANADFNEPSLTTLAGVDDELEQQGIVEDQPIEQDPESNRLPSHDDDTNSTLHDAVDLKLKPESEVKLEEDESMARRPLRGQNADALPSSLTMKVTVSDFTFVDRKDTNDTEIPKVDRTKGVPIFAFSLRPFYTHGILFAKGSDNYAIFRNPAITQTAGGTLMAFAEARKYSALDYGDIDIVLRRSTDNGESWSPLQVVATGRGDTAGNPAPVVDKRSGLITLIYCRNGGADTEDEIRTGYAPPRTIWKIHSTDDGVTWTPEKEISKFLRRWYWSWYATGPGHGIQLRTGRLVIPCYHAVRGFLGLFRGPSTMDRSHVIYSDTYGLTWSLGASSMMGTGLSTVAETPSGQLYLNSQSMRNATTRVAAWSFDFGKTFLRKRNEPTLIEPINNGAHGSLLRVNLYGNPAWGALLFSNPASLDKTHMTVSLSVDNGDSWIKLKTIYEGRSGSSDMATAPDQSINLIYESEDDIALDRFNLPWLLSGL